VKLQRPECALGLPVEKHEVPENLRAAHHGEYFKM
jgi:hypothetical protein